MIMMSVLILDFADFILGKNCFICMHFYCLAFFSIMGVLNKIPGFLNLSKETSTYCLPVILSLPSGPLGVPLNQRMGKNISILLLER